VGFVFGGGGGGGFGCGCDSGPKNLATHVNVQAVGFI